MKQQGGLSGHTGWLLLAERPESFLQWAGAAIVVLTITWYLSQQQRQPEPIIESSQASFFLTTKGKDDVQIR